MTPEQISEAKEVIRQVAGYYARTCYTLSRGELEQEGWLRALEACQQSWEGRFPFRTFIRTVVSRELSRFCWTVSTPVHHWAPSKATCKEFSKVDIEHVASAHCRPIEQIEDAQDLQAAREALRARLVQLHDEHTRKAAVVPREVVDASVSILMDGGKVATVCPHLPAKAVYGATERIITHARRDEVAKSLLTRIVENRRNLHVYAEETQR